MGVNIDAIKKEFKLIPFGNKGWFNSNMIECPNCKKTGKFGIKFSEKGGAVNCFKCDHHQGIYKYLIEIDRRDLIKDVEQASFKTTVKSIEDLIEESKSLELSKLDLPEISLPFKTVKVDSDAYLDERNFCSEHYENFDVRVTNSLLSLDYKDYIIFSIFQNYKRVALLCRSKRSKAWHKQNDEDAKTGKAEMFLRYKNSSSDFAKILGGYDEVTNITHTLILVEGIFDKNGVDYNLELCENDEIKCNFTFGNKLSDDQISLIKKKKSVKNVIMMYDSGTTGQQKSSALKLSRHFDVTVCHIDNPDVDPGDMTFDYMSTILENRRSAFEYYITSLNVQK